MLDLAETIAVLCDARALYEAYPSHAPAGDYPAPGTHCVRSAIAFSYGGAMAQVALGALVRAGDVRDSVFGFPLIAHWNAEHSTAEVLAAFDTAIDDLTARLREHLGVVPVEPVAEVVA